MFKRFFSLCLLIFPLASFAEPTFEQTKEWIESTVNSNIGSSVHSYDKYERAYPNGEYDDYIKISNCYVSSKWSVKFVNPTDNTVSWWKYSYYEMPLKYYKAGSAKIAAKDNAMSYWRRFSLDFDRHGYYDRHSFGGEELKQNVSNLQVWWDLSGAKEGKDQEFEQRLDKAFSHLKRIALRNPQCKDKVDPNLF